MKNKFNWYLGPSDDELDEIWKKGTLTLDTNVLLDLYRYHEETRDSLIQSIKNFQGKKWLSYQAADEFFRNRAKVIISSGASFKQATDQLNKFSDSLKSTVDHLKGNRIIPSNIAETLRSSVENSIIEASKSIQDGKNSYPNYREFDPILKQLLEIFDNSIGESFDEKNLNIATATAEERKKDKTPPGFMDKEKDGDRPFGDYFLWRQTLEYSKANKTPVILVTSERKEDWWEIISGQTVGPRSELLKESISFTGQRVLIYQTDKFLEYAQKRLNAPINKIAIEEIRALGESNQLGPAVKILGQDEIFGLPALRDGTLTVEITRPVKNFTASGRFDPHMIRVPRITAQLGSSPDNTPSFKIKPGTGTVFDFNIGIRCDSTEDFLPQGIYKFYYSAECIEINPNGTD